MLGLDIRIRLVAQKVIPEVLGFLFLLGTFRRGNGAQAILFRLLGLTLRPNHRLHCLPQQAPGRARPDLAITHLQDRRRQGQVVFLGLGQVTVRLDGLVQHFPHPGHQFARGHLGGTPQGRRIAPMLVNRLGAPAFIGSPDRGLGGLERPIPGQLDALVIALILAAGPVIGRAIFLVGQGGEMGGKVLGVGGRRNGGRSLRRGWRLGRGL